MVLRCLQQDPDSNMIFQAMNGSGKTGAFGIPAVMKTDPSLAKI